MFGMILPASKFVEVSEKKLEMPLVRLGVEALRVPKAFCILTGNEHIIKPVKCASGKHPKDVGRRAKLSHGIIQVDWIRQYSLMLFCSGGTSFLSTRPRYHL